MDTVISGLAVPPLAAATVAIPAPIVTQSDLSAWYNLTIELEKIKTAELELRKKIFAGFFTDPNEGVNTAQLSEGWVLKGQHKINRSVDIALLTAHMADLRTFGVPCAGYVLVGCCSPAADGPTPGLALPCCPAPRISRAVPSPSKPRSDKLHPVRQQRIQHSTVQDLTEQ